MLKSVGASGQITLGKKYSGRYFELEEQSNGELLLRPVKLVRDAPVAKAGRKAISFRIAEVERVVIPNREERNARR